MGLFKKSKDVTLDVEGMTCSHCVQSVEEAIGGVPDVKKAKVDLDTGEVWVRGTPELDPGALVHAVEDAGYQARAR